MGKRVSLAVGYLLQTWESELRALAGIGTKESFQQIGCRNDHRFEFYFGKQGWNYDGNVPRTPELRRK
jgi:hypothetical protein